MSPEESTIDFAKSPQPSPPEMSTFDFRCPAAGSDLSYKNLETSCLTGLELKLAGLVQERINHCLTILDAFEHELPDPNQELFLQYDPMFTCFEQFPTELREQPIPIKLMRLEGACGKFICTHTITGLKIWGLLFPRSRRVNLVDPCSPGLACVKRYRVGHHSLPITLRINAECRRETLRHYTILMPEDVSYTFERFVRKPLCFSAKRDALYIENCRGIGSAKLAAFIAHLQEKTNGSLSEINSIYWTHLCAWPTGFAQLKRHAGLPWTADDCMKPWEDPSMLKFYHNYILGDDPLKALLLLSGLKDLTFGLRFLGNHYPQWPLGSSPTHKEVCSQFEEVLNVYYEQRKDLFESKTAPKAIVMEVE